MTMENVETRLRPYCGEEPQLSGHRKWLARADRKGENAPRQPELWLEELLCQDVSRIDHLLDNLSVYRQVFSFVGADRGILDILTRTRNGRLAVLELKMQEDVNFVLQGLDYWMRVQWLNDRSQLQKFGYFPHRPLSSRSPLLYLISPAFRFHSTTDGVGPLSFATGRGHQGGNRAGPAGGASRCSFDDKSSPRSRPKVRGGDLTSSILTRRADQVPGSTRLDPHPTD